MLLALVAIAIHNYRAMREDALALSQGVIANLQQGSAIALWTEKMLGELVEAPTPK